MLQLLRVGDVCREIVAEGEEQVRFLGIGKR